MGVSRATLYRAKKTGEYLVQAMCAHPLGGDVAIGAPLLLAPEGLESRLAAALLEALARYRSAIWDPSLGVRRDKGFRRDHDFLFVTYDDETQLLELLPGRLERGGYHGTRDQAVYVRFDDAERDLAGAVRLAFGRVTE